MTETSSVTGRTTRDQLCIDPSGHRDLRPLLTRDMTGGSGVNASGISCSQRTTVTRL
jgi:hypothetical protein